MIGASFLSLKAILVSTRQQVIASTSVTAFTLKDDASVLRKHIEEAFV
jgi:hypothetical protein